MKKIATLLLILMTLGLSAQKLTAIDDVNGRHRTVLMTDFILEKL